MSEGQRDRASSSSASRGSRRGSGSEEKKSRPSALSLSPSRARRGERELSRGLSECWGAFSFAPLPPAAFSAARTARQPLRGWAVMSAFKVSVPIGGSGEFASPPFRKVSLLDVFKKSRPVSARALCYFNFKLCTCKCVFGPWAAAKGARGRERGRGEEEGSAAFAAAAAPE